MELFARLNSVLPTLVKSESQTLLDELFVKDPSQGVNQLLDRYKTLDSDVERSDFVYDFFLTAFHWVNRELEDTDHAAVGVLGDAITALCDDSRKNFDIFVSLMNCFPWNTKNGLPGLLGCMSSWQMEMCVYMNDPLLSKSSEQWAKNFWSSFKKRIVPEFFILPKANVFLECSTGFSQLVTLLNIAFDDVDRFQSVVYYSKQLNFIMGKYRLDPIRSLDLILQICSLYIVTHYEFIIELLKETDFWPYDNLADCTVYESLCQGGNPVATRIIINHLNSNSDDKLYIDLVIHLIGSGFVSFAAIFDSLLPQDDLIEEYIKNKLLALEKKSLEGSLNPLAMAAVLPDDDLESKSSGSSDTKQSKDSKTAEEADTALNERVEQSPKWRLVERLLVHGYFIPGLYALMKYPGFFKVNQNLTSRILQVFDKMLLPLLQGTNKVNISKDCRPLVKLSNDGIPTKQYRLVRKYESLDILSRSIQGNEYSFYAAEYNSDMIRIETIEQLFEYSHLIFGVLGPLLISNPRLVENICAIAECDILENPESAMIEKWIDYSRKFLLPVLGLIEEEQMIANSIFSVLRHFPYEKRYYLYNELSTKISEDDIHVRLNFAKYQKKIRSLLKSLSIDNISFKCRDVANYISCNPLSTVTSVLKQIENYDKVSELIVTSAEFFSDFAYDVLQYALLIQLSSGRPTLQDDGISSTVWITRLSLFVAGLAKVCPKFDLSNIFVFLVKILHKDPSLTLSILKELITQVAGIQTLYDVNWTTLLMLNSGDALKEMGKTLVLDFRDRYFSRSRAIIQYLVDLNAVSEMIIMLTSLNLKIQSDNVHYKILSTKCDESNSLLWSFIEMLKHVLSECEFIKNVLPFNVLIEDYQMPIEWAFNIWRDYFDKKLTRSDEDAEHINKILYDTKFSSVNFEHLEKDLLIQFWRLSLYDIRLEESLYKNQETLLREKRKKATVLKDRHALLNKLQNVTNDHIAHKKICEDSRKLLQEKTSEWFPEFTDDRIIAFLQYCIMPRVIFSPFDAIYCATFLTEAFEMPQLLQIVGQLINSRIIGTLLFSSTVNESSNISLFFKDLFRKIEAWRKSPGFDADVVNETNKTLLLNLYFELTEQLSFGLEEENYMSIRNTIQFLNFVCEVFPVVDIHLEMILETLDRLLEHETRRDIILPSNALKGHLTARLKSAAAVSEFVNAFDANNEQLRSELELIQRYQQAKKAEAEEQRRKEEAERKRQARIEGKSPATLFVASSLGTDSYGEGRAISTQELVASLYKIDSYIKDSDYTKATTLIYDAQTQSDYRKLINNPNNINGFRNKLKILFEDYFDRLRDNPTDEEQSAVDTLIHACQSAQLPQPKVLGGMYEDDVRPTKSAAKTLAEKKTVPSKDEIPTAPSSRYQAASSGTPAAQANTLPKAPANAVKTSDFTPKATNNSGSRFNSSSLPSGPRKDSSNTKNSGNADPNSTSTQASYRTHNTGKNFSGTPAESRTKRPADDSSQGSSRFSNFKRSKPSEQRITTTLPTGPKKQTGTSRFSR